MVQPLRYVLYGHNTEEKQRHRIENFYKTYSFVSINTFPPPTLN